MAIQPFKVAEIKARITECYRQQGHEILRPFPLLTNDPSVLFTNATITPLKGRYTDGSPHADFALVQNCLRMGGASDLEQVGVDPYFFTLFEMFGCGSFSGGAKRAVSLLLAALEEIGIAINDLWFTVPVERDSFTTPLRECGIHGSRIFSLEKNGAFWQSWQFGRPGLTGHGMTVIFSGHRKTASSISDMQDPVNGFFELLNIIDIHSWTSDDGEQKSLLCNGFDMGAGIERLAAAVQGCDPYQIDSIKPLVQCAETFLQKNGERPDEPLARICTDHMRASTHLICEGIKPSNKGPGYVLRKLIRRILSKSWMHLRGEPDYGLFISEFMRLLDPLGQESPSIEKIMTVFTSECAAIRRLIADGRRIIRTKPGIDPEKLSGTYGLSPDITTIVRQKG